MNGDPTTSTMRRLLNDLGFKHPPSVRMIEAIAVTSDDPSDPVRYWQLRYSHVTIRAAIASCKDEPRDRMLAAFTQALRVASAPEQKGIEDKSASA